MVNSMVTSLQKSQNEERTSMVDSMCLGGNKPSIPVLHKSEEPDFNTNTGNSLLISSATVDKPVDLSTKKENDTDSTTQGKFDTFMKKKILCMFHVRYTCLFI